MKAHCIAYPIKILLFRKFLLFFQNKARIAEGSDNEFIVIKFFVHDNSLYCFIVR